MGFEAEAAAQEYASTAERNAAIDEGKKADNAERKRVKAITDERMVQYRGEWLRAWQTTASAQ
ncbi:hypothetical protein P8605_28055 [Streptomyces sp. T-3]|nr:hypothetical protein [Streptomyces sp. T-3]